MPAKRYYTVGEANAEVPRLNELFGAVMQLRGLLKELYRNLEEADAAPSSEADLPEFGDDLDDEDSDEDEDVRRDLMRFKGMADALKEQVQAIMATGCVIKDIETGLVDWPALHNGHEIWLCWRYGETEVAWWHDQTSGFAGRQPIALLQEPRGPGATGSP
jgi:hypothetical protein